MIIHDNAALLAYLRAREVVASVSGGKDSAALALYLMELGIPFRSVFLDTGWEHPVLYEYLRGELTRVIGPITEIRGERLMEDLIRKKGMFPSRLRRFCTQELKVYPMQKHLNQLMDSGLDVVNAVGIRHEESASRSKMPEWEWQDGFDCEVWRPLISWTEQDVIDIHKRHGLKPNPLYLLGASRVGCWPCIYARKAEIKLIADIDPERIDRIRALENEVSATARARAEAAGKEFKAPFAWFQARTPEHVTEEQVRIEYDENDEPRAAGVELRTRRVYPPWPIDRVIEWSRTPTRPGEAELMAADPRDAGCMRWGLCETDKKPEGEEKA